MGGVLPDADAPLLHVSRVVGLRGSGHRPPAARYSEHFVVFEPIRLSRNLTWVQDRPSLRLVLWRCSWTSLSDDRRKGKIVGFFLFTVMIN